MRTAWRHHWLICMDLTMSLCWAFSLLFSSLYFPLKHIHMTYTSSLGVNQKHGFVCAALQNFFWILSEMLQLLHTSNMSLPSHTLSHRLDLPSTVQPLTSADDMWELHCGEEQHHWRKLLGLTKWCKVLVERQTPCQSSDMTGTSKWQGSCLLRGMRQSGRQPEKDDDRQTACWCYQRLPICLRIPQDIGHGYMTAVYRVSG